MEEYFWPACDLLDSCFLLCEGWLAVVVVKGPHSDENLTAEPSAWINSGDG